MSTVKLRFKATKSHRNHYDDWNLLKDGEVGEYPEDIAKQKLADFPNNFEMVKKLKPVGEEKQTDRTIEEKPDKALKAKRTKTK